MIFASAIRFICWILNWYNQLRDKGIFFVTRRSVLQSKGLTSDQTIEFIGSQTANKCPLLLRHIGYRDVETGKRLDLLCETGLANDFVPL
jgi:hypothetical protein